MSLSKTISNDQLNELLGNLNASTEITAVGQKLQEAADQYKSTIFTKVGKQAGEVIAGVESLTAVVDETAEELIEGIGVTRLNDNIPGYDTALKTVASASSEISKITGAANAAQGALKEIISSSAPKAIAQCLQQVTDIAPQASTLSQVTNSEFASVITSNVSQFNALSNNIQTTLGSLQTVVNSTLGSLSGGILNRLVTTANDALKNELVTLTQGLLNEEVILVAQDLILKGDRNLALTLIDTELNISLRNGANISTGQINSLLEEVSRIDPSISNIVNSQSNSSVNFGNPTTPISQLGADEQNWSGSNTPVSPGVSTSAPVNTGPTPQPQGESFSFVNSYEELVSDFRATTREITETVVHWTANYIDQGHIGSEEIHRVHLQRGFSGCGYHYIIKRNGDLQRGRPVNVQGAHALANGHNKYSIGVGIVAGYNCPSGTKNRNRYVSSESISPEQWNTLNQFMKAFYDVWPGGQAWGHNDTDPGNKVDPGFDVPEYVFRKFGKRNVTESGTMPPLSPTTLAATRRSDEQLRGIL